MNPFALVSLVLGTLCLAKSVIDRREAGPVPLLTLLRDRYPALRASEVAVGVALGTAAILAPIAFSLAWPVAVGWTIGGPTIHWLRAARTGILPRAALALR